MKNYILFDEANRISLRPLTFFRPISLIRVGILTIAEKWEYYLNTKVSYLTEDYLQDVYKLEVKNDNILINSSILPDSFLLDAIDNLKTDSTLVHDNLLVAMRLSSENLINFSSGETSDLESVEYTNDIKQINHSWDIIKYNKSEIESDFEILTFGRESEFLSESNIILGDNYFIDKNAEVECCVLDTRNGPIYIGKNATVMTGSQLRGPLAIGDNATVKMGALLYEGTSIGPHCKVGGEISNSIFFGYSSKAHDGYLGDSVIAEWCNLGAGTTNSNLKNNYKSVKMWDYENERFVDTKMQFCGLVMGDHSKTGISTMFNTGTTVGVCCNLFGSEYHRNFVPSFSWGSHGKYQDYEIEQVMQTAEVAMKRRNIILSEADKKIFHGIKKLSQRYKYF